MTFTFGNLGGAAAAPSGNAAKPVAGPAPTFSFGGAAPTPAAAAPSTSAAASPAPGPAFSFGGNAPSTETTTAPTFSFSGAAPATAPAQATTATSITSTAAPANSYGAMPAAAAGSSSTAITTTTTLIAPDFDDTFENLNIWNRTRKLCSETSIQQTESTTEAMTLAGQDLMYFLSTHARKTLKPRVVEWTQPNHALRQQLAQKPFVALSGGVSTTLTVKTLGQIGLLATELRISEAQAITLYAQVSRDYDVLNSLLTSNTADGGGCGLIDRALPDAKYDDVTKLARDFYFYERRLKLETILYLVELRLHNNPDIIRATDVLLDEGQLIINLIAVIREYTQRIEQLKQEIKSNTTSTTPSSTASIVGGSGGFLVGSQQQPQQYQQVQHQQKPLQFAKVHLLFCIQERQTAAEALVFIAYHTQMEVKEVTALIDLIRDLSTGTPKLCPFKDVPSPYESSPTGIDNMNLTHQQYGAANSWLPPVAKASYPWDRKDKSSLEWEKELIYETCKTGQPLLLQCYSLIIVAAMAALETRQILYDRKTHGPNDFGRGNQLLHPTNPSLENIKDLHTKLKPEAHKQWARPDIWGLLACSYALLLRMTPLAITSPTKGGSNTSFSKEVRDAARYCVEVPTEFMSFTFCRLTLIPSLENIKSTSMRTICDVSEFCLSVVTEVYSLYLDILSEGTGNLPISRRRWQDREEEDLNLQRAQYNNQRKFELYMRKNSHDEPSKREIPAAVNLMERHECLDDLIALATTLCSLGPNYSRYFWTEDNETKALIPSRALQECTVQASQDESLIPYLYSWMAALSNDEQSAKAINYLMSNDKNNDSSSEGTASSLTSWSSVIHCLRFYVQHLSFNNDGNVSKPSSPMTKTSAKNNTSYYYNLEGNVMPGASNASRSHDSGGRTKSSSSSSSSSSSASKKSLKPQELSEGSILRVASYLALIMNVSLHCLDARYDILSINLPLVEGDLTAGGDECLVVLFKLAIAPLPPQMRGATFSTIASLLHPTVGIEDSKKKSFLEEQGNNAWEYLESCSLLPINLLDRYRVVKPNGTDVEDQAALSFPPSSMSLASLPNRTTSNIPKHPMYGVLYEMDHIESKKGWYPSTEGFLYLLNALVSSVGCPSKLGRNWRVRTGCTPYLEYVINFVLPKALGIDHQPALPFRVLGDRSRLVARALAVVEAIIIRYNLHAPSLKTKGKLPTPISKLGIKAVVDEIHLGSNQENGEEVANDFKNITVSSTLHAHNQQSGSTKSTMNLVSNQAFMGSSSVSTVPVPKSPGFTILIGLLYSSSGVLLQALGVVLTECGGRNGILSFFREESNKMDLTYALFGSTPPNLNSAKEGIKENGPSKPLQTLLKRFSPKFQAANIDDHYADNSVFWRERSIALALRIFCAAIAREDAFVETVVTSKELLKLVPVIEFQELKPGSGSALAMDMRAKDVKVSRLSDLLFQIRDSRFLRSNIVDYVGYDSVSKIHGAEISAAALSIVYRMQQTKSPGTSLRSLCGIESSTSAFSKSIADRLLISSRNVDEVRDPEIVSLILNWILVELRSGVIVNEGLTQVLLGLPGHTNRDGNWKPGCGHYSGAVSDCFDAILDILGDLSTGFSSVTTLCFEIFFRLYDLIKTRDAKSLKIVIYTAERLREVGFWRDNILRIPYIMNKTFQNSEKFIHNLHSIGWLLKGLSYELRLLVGFEGDSISVSEFGRYLEQHQVKCNSLLSSLYGTDKGVMQNLVNNLPLGLLSMDPNLHRPSPEALRAGVYDLPGAHDIVQDYKILDSMKVISVMNRKGRNSESQSVKEWVEEWNFIASRDCAVSHLTNAISVLIDASLYSVGSMSRCHTSILESSNFSHSWLQNNGLRDLLLCFLQKLDDIPGTSDHHGMDKFLVPVATKNLSNIVLTLSEFITSPEVEDVVNSSDLLQLAALIARTIRSSSIGDNTAVEAPFRYERTSSLGSALSLLLCSSAASEPGFVSQYREDFIMAADKLVGIADFKVNSGSNDGNGIVSMLARGYAASIVLAMSHFENDSNIENSYACKCISKVFLERSISLVAELDEDICNFLQVIALQSSGAEKLIDAGIGQALLHAAREYVEQERIEIKKYEGKSSGFTKTTIRTPEFLLSHLKLICTLLEETKLPQHLAYDFASNSIDIIEAYQSTIYRLCYNFPVQADFLRWFLKALVVASSIVKPLKKKIQIHKINHDKKELISCTGLLENGIVMLLEQLSENPLPNDMFPERIPKELKSRQGSFGSNVVNVERDDSATWWDVLKEVMTSRQNTSQACFFPAPISVEVFVPTKLRKWREDTFEYSIVAADILFLGLQLLKRIERPDLFSNSSLAYGLFRCALAAKTVDDRLENVRSKISNRLQPMETDENSENTELELEYLKMLASSLAQCAEQLLLLCFLSCDSNEDKAEHVSKQILVAIESSGLNHASLSVQTEERKEFMHVLCNEIEKIYKKSRNRPKN